MERDCRMGWGEAREGEDVEERIGYSFQPSIGSEKGNSSFRAVRVRWDSWDYLKKIGPVNGRPRASPYRITQKCPSPIASPITCA